MASSFLSHLGDDQLLKRVQDTHAPGAAFEIDMRPILSIAEDIMSRVKPQSDERAETPSQDQNKIVVVAARIALESPINYASYMLTWKCVDGADEDTVTIELLNSVLAKYPWDAKAVIAYAAFAINYGELWLLKNPKNNKLAHSMAALMNFSSDLEMDTWKAVHDLLTVLMGLICCIIELKDIPSKYKNIQLAVYRIVSSLVVCASLLTDTFCNNYKSSYVEVKEKIEKLESKLSPVLQEWEDQVNQYRHKQEVDKSFIEFVRMMDMTTHLDNMKVLNAFIGMQERNEMLRRKYVLLLITDLDLSAPELNILCRLYGDSSTGREYEIIWLPIVNPLTFPMSPSQEIKFEELRRKMPWFSVKHPSAINPVVFRYIQEEWNFNHGSILVAFDPCEKLIHRDALPMMKLWGNLAFPFTPEKEGMLWNGIDEWNLEVIIDGIHPLVEEWANSGKVICLYGADNVDWVRMFTQSARTATHALKVPLEMLYVGKSNLTEKVRLCHKVIVDENLSHILAPDYNDFVWYFWERLASMLQSRLQIGKIVEDDLIMKGILELLSYDGNEHGWAVFSRGNNEIAMGKGDKVVPVLEDYTTWAKEVDPPDNFVRVLDERVGSHNLNHHCNRLILPSQTGYSPDVVVCDDCGKFMEKYIMYRCCTD